MDITIIQLWLKYNILWYIFSAYKNSSRQDLYLKEHEHLRKWVSQLLLIQWNSLILCRLLQRNIQYIEGEYTDLYATCALANTLCFACVFQFRQTCWWTDKVRIDLAPKFFNYQPLKYYKSTIHAKIWVPLCLH